MWHPDLAGKPAEPAIRACGLGIPPRPSRGDPRGHALSVRVTQSTNLRIGGEHDEPSTMWVPSA
ncbi:hypothetical protein FRUB_04608 [Fimbriiglobus ruber]|uniref:Uncharacterized protein n=1 Tax=Fimbriiglobus ruber TaxID=1908690 RepID=A0A225DY20_9BACT|nr:hypothetical protein FRUB_04608 [Fimbriiglobus ruber]